MENPDFEKFEKKLKNQKLETSNVLPFLINQEKEGLAASHPRRGLTRETVTSEKIILYTLVPVR